MCYCPLALQITSICLLSYFCRFILEKREENTKKTKKPKHHDYVSLHYLVVTVTAILFSRTTRTGTRNGDITLTGSSSSMHYLCLPVKWIYMTLIIDYEVLINVRGEW